MLQAVDGCPRAKRLAPSLPARPLPSDARSSPAESATGKASRESPGSPSRPSRTAAPRQTKAVLRVTGAGSKAYNGAYKKKSEFNGKPLYRKLGEPSIEIAYMAGGHWMMQKRCAQALAARTVTPL